jgi:hypothetical protein
MCEYGADNSFELLFVMIIFVWDWFRFHGQRHAITPYERSLSCNLPALRYDQSYGDLRDTGRSAYHACSCHGCLVGSMVPVQTFLNPGARSGLSPRNALITAWSPEASTGNVRPPGCPINPKAKRRLFGTKVAEVVDVLEHAVMCTTSESRGFRWPQRVQ